MNHRPTLRARTLLRMSLALAVCCTFAVGCADTYEGGYRTGEVYRGDIRTVAVPIFGNTSYERGIERDVTDAIIKEIHARTPYRVTAGSGADSILTGTITKLARTRLSADRTTGLVQEMAIQITVNFEWTDERSGDLLVARRSFSSGEYFIPAAGVREPIEVGIHQAVAELARDIVSAMRADW
ncbi:MAG: LptE family protein [Phycisphaerales bacterium]|nr:LptE family protein [Phycisphaerales bacterium]